MHTFGQNQTASEAVAPPVGATVSLALASDAQSEKAVAVLLEAAENAEQTRRVVQRAANVLALVFCATSVSWTASVFLHRSLWLDGAMIMASLSINGFNLIFRKGRSPATPLRKVVSRLLLFPDDPRFLLPLIDALTTAQTFEERSKSFLLLTEHLWNLTPADAALSLDDTRRLVLRRCLSSICRRPSAAKREANAPQPISDLTADLAVALMKTLSGLGDKKSVTVLEKIIKAEAVTPNETVVRDAAREYLPALVQKSAENDEIHKQLRLCVVDTIRDPQKAIAQFVDTLVPENAKAVLVEFLREQSRRDRYTGLLFYVGAVVVAGLSCLLLLSGLIHSAGLTGAVGPFLGVFVSLMLAYASDSTGGFYYVRKVTVELSRRTWDDPRITPFLLNAAQGVHKPHGDDSVKKALVRLLPLLQPGDAALVPPAQRATLRAWLKTPRSKKKAGNSSQTLTIAALDALAALGDTKALPAAKNIAFQTRSGNYRDAELHEAAVRCVAALEGRRDSSGLN